MFQKINLLFLVRFQTDNNVQVSIDKQIDFMKKNKLTLQPYVIAVGSLEEVTHFFVVLNDIKYKFQSIVMAIDFCFKLFFVLNLKYSVFCDQIWTFIQKYFYQISTKFDVNSTAVIAALTDLNT